MVNRSFEFSAGCLALDFLDTLSGRATSSPRDLLNTPEDLARWSALAGYTLPSATLADLEEAVALRDAIGRTADALESGRTPPARDTNALNTWAEAPGFRPRWEGGEQRYRAVSPVPALLSTIAADAILSLLAGDRARVRRCPDCRMIFKDTSRQGRRVWCSSSSGCGNRAKVRRHRARAKGETPT